MAVNIDGIQTIQHGNFIFQLRARDSSAACKVVTEWAFFIQHNMPKTHGLHQQISSRMIPFPTRLFPKEESEYMIPEPTYHSQYIDDNSANQVFPLQTTEHVSPLQPKIPINQTGGGPPLLF